MNRIYQGRVTKVEVPDENGDWKLLNDGQAALWLHHELFQYLTSLKICVIKKSLHYSDSQATSKNIPNSIGTINLGKIAQVLVTSPLR